MILLYLLTNWYLLAGKSLQRIPWHRNSLDSATKAKKISTSNNLWKQTVDPTKFKNQAQKFNSTNSSGTDLPEKGVVPKGMHCWHGRMPAPHRIKWTMQLDHAIGNGRIWIKTLLCPFITWVFFSESQHLRLVG